MKHRLKFFVPAIAALAVFLAVASPAMATTHSFRSDGTTTQLTAEAQTTQRLIATPVDEQYFQCNKVSVTGALEGEEAASITVTPAYAECGLFEGETKLAVGYVELESCHYVFGGETVETKVGSHAQVAIECDEPGDHIEFKLTALKLNCLSVPAQEISGIRYKNAESGGTEHLAVEATTSGVETTTTSSLACPTEGGETEKHNNGTLLGEVTLKGDNGSGKATDIGLGSGPKGHDFKSGSAGGTTHLTTAAEPGEAGHQVFETTTGEHKAWICSAVNTTGVIEGSPVEEITVEPQYSACGVYQTKVGAESTSTEGTEKLASASFVNGGCHYRLFGVTAGGNPTGSQHANIKIENASETCTHINTTVTALKLKCFSVPSEQTIEHAVRYENQVTEGGTEDLGVEATAHGIENTTTNSAACPTKTGETEVHDNGSYVGAFSVTGFADEAHEEPTDVTIE